MKINTPTFQELFRHPEMQKQVNLKNMQGISERLERASQIPAEPVFVRVLAGIGAWVAAFFLVLFVYEINHKDTVAIIGGIIFLVTGIFCGRISRATFVQQLSLALVFAGHILVLYGVGNHVSDMCVEETDIIMSLVFTQAVLCSLIYPIYANSIYRFLAPIAFFQLLMLWINWEEAFAWKHVLIAAEALLAGILLFKKKIPAYLRPLAFSAAFMLPATLLSWNIEQTIDKFEGINKALTLWPESLFLSGSLIYSYFYLSGGLRRSTESWMVLAVAATILLGVFSTPGILVVMGLLVLGYGLDEKMLTWLAYAFLPVFLIVFYYNLNIDLAYKSWIIAGSGAILLGVRWIAGRLMPKEVAQ